jgi:hypothetical protein
MSAWLYKSGQLLAVDTPEHVGVLREYGIATVADAVSRGWVRIRRTGDLTAFQARSKDLARSAARLFFRSERTTAVVAIEFPGRYVEMTPAELCDFL